MMQDQARYFADRGEAFTAFEHIHCVHARLKKGKR